MTEYTRRLRAEIASLEAMLPMLALARDHRIYVTLLARIKAKLAAELSVFPETED